MSNNFVSTGFTVTSTFQKLSTLLTAAGVDTASASVTGSDGYFKNNSASVNLLVGTGVSSPTYYATVPPLAGIPYLAGMNTNEVWLKSASSTVAVDFVEGATYTPAIVNGVIGEITATENTVPKADANGDLVASSITDDGATVVIDEDVTITGAISGSGGLGADGPVHFGSTVEVDGASTLTGATTLGGEISPSVNDGAALGDATHNFSDLFLATGALLNYANGNVVVTHSSGILTMGTGEMRITTPGTNAASVVTVGGTQTLTAKTLTTPVINGGAALGSTSTEIDQYNDVSAYQESIIAAGALTITKKYSGLALVGSGAVTLAAPGATMLGQTKVIEMTTDNGDVTLALTNVEGQSSGTTATFNDVGDKLIVMGGASKWTVIKEFGITLS